jgi:tRNA-uridine 2-sulfurtransferase
MSPSSTPQRIVVAMSGGVDSTVTAALLQRQGHEVIGVTLQLYDQGKALAGSRTCCAGRDIYDARAAADRLGIAHYVLDYEARFRAAVIEGFAETYARGLTPIPCVHCNARIKFGDLLTAARDLGADALATGHYVELIAGPDGPELHRAVDAARDQSYFLFSTPRTALPFLRFPLGGLHKPEVRTLAAELGLANAAKPDSQDICFVPDGRYAELVETLKPEAVRPGAIVDRAGQVLGRHAGIIHFTVGQRKGLNLSGQGEPLFVLRLDAEKAEVVVGPRAALATREVRLETVNWLADPALAADCAVKVRSMRPPVPAQVTADGTGARVALLQPEAAIAPGQACVFYAGTRVLGGGWIAGAA